MSGAPDTRPAELAARGVEKWGETGFIDRCVGLLQTMSWGDEPELMTCMAAAGPRFVELGPGNQEYFLRVWPLRAFLYAWDPRAEQAVVAALADEHWRVREMAAKVAALRQIGAAAGPASALLSDPVPRVRAAAARVLGQVGEAEDAGGLRVLMTDGDRAVAAVAGQSLRLLAQRTDRPVDQLGR
jgi:hypothetical protein